MLVSHTSWRAPSVFSFCTDFFAPTVRESSLRFNAKNFLKGAPVRWNEEHTLCVAPGAHPSQMCQDHFDIYAETLPSNER